MADWGVGARNRTQGRIGDPGARPNVPWPPELGHNRLEIAGAGESYTEWIT